LTWLRKVFDSAPIDSISPQFIAQYRDKRGQIAPVRANREISLFSHVWNLVREWGYTAKENPIKGVRKNKETPRDFYADDQVWAAVYSQASEELRDAMDLNYLTGQRPADVLKMRLSDIKEGALEVTQNKTKKKLRILIEDELLNTLDRIKSRNRKVSSLLELGDANLALKIRAFQFRDFRPKAASEISLEHASKLLGHTDQEITSKV
jgi:integrase